MILLLFALFFIVSEACYEALSLDDKESSGCIEFFNRGMGAIFFLLFMTGVDNPIAYDDLLSTPFNSFLGSVVSYLIIREAIFDYIYNWVAGLRWDYIGKTKRRDKFYRKYFSKVPSTFMAFARFCILLPAIAYMLKSSF